MNDTLAPIVVFTYNRPDVVKNTIEVLASNLLACDSRIIIYSDAPKKSDDNDRVTSVRKYLSTVHGFKSVEVIERKENMGLANNIIDGVTAVSNKYGKVIVLEDDILTSKYFLSYMNDALRIFEDNKKVMQIGGYTYPFDKTGLPESFFLKKADCWGWGIWRDRWQLFERDTEKMIRSTTKDEIYKINMDGKTYYWSQILDNRDGTLNTWAIYLHAIAYKNDMHTLYPREAMSRPSFIKQGEHGETQRKYYVSLAEEKVNIFPDDCEICKPAEIRLEKCEGRLEPIDNELVRCVKECSIHFDKRTVALWGMGKMGKLFLQEMCRPEMRKFSVECFDSYKKCYKHTDCLNNRDVYFVVVTILHGYEKITEVLDKCGYEEGNDYICLGKLYK